MLVSKYDYLYTALLAKASQSTCNCWWTAHCGCFTFKPPGEARLQGYNAKISSECVSKLSGIAWKKWLLLNNITNHHCHLSLAVTSQLRDRMKNQKIICLQCACNNSITWFHMNSIMSAILALQWHHCNASLGQIAEIMNFSCCCRWLWISKLTNTGSFRKNAV